MTTVIAVLATVAFGFGVVAWANPLVRRIAVRHALHRPGESTLVVLGSMLGTAFVVSAMLVSASVSSSVRSATLQRLGPIDLVATIRGSDDLDKEPDRLVREIERADIGEVDGAMTLLSAAAVLDNRRSGDDFASEPGVCVGELDLDSARRFGGGAGANGVSNIASIAQDEVVLSESIATTLNLRAGQPIVVRLFDSSAVMTVATVKPDRGLLGFCRALVAPGAVRLRWQGVGTDRQQIEGPDLDLLISIVGDEHRVATTSETVSAEIRRVLGDNADIDELKARGLASAKRSGATMGALFSGVGGFSVIAGLLLLVNVMVMLVDDRSVELGMLRAMGMKRRRVVQVISAEGSLYAAASTILGAILGIAMTALVLRGSEGLFSRRLGDYGIRLSVPGRVLVQASFLGMLLAMVAIVATAVRISRLNIVSALRAATMSRHNVRGHRLRGAALTLVGLTMLVMSLITRQQLGLLVAVPAAALGVGLLVPKRHGRTAAFGLGCASLVWGLGVFSWFRDAMAHASIATFVLLGVVLVISAVVACVAATPLLSSGVARVFGGGLVPRLAMAAPTARSGRTGLLITMFALVVFTMTFISTVTSSVAGQVEGAASAASAGYDVVLDWNRGSVLTEPRLLEDPDVASVAMVSRAAITVTAPYLSEPEDWAVAGYGSEFLAFGAPQLSARLPQFADDHEVFAAVIDDPRLVVVSSQFGLRGGAPKSVGPAPGDEVTMTAPSGETVRLIVAGVLTQDPMFWGAMWSGDALERLAAPAITTSWAFARLSVGAETNPSAAASRINVALRDVGMNARTMADQVRDATSQTASVLNLLQSYLALGLLIGVLGLTVVLVRAVHERRYEIGMLRALGARSAIPRRVFIAEAAFISILASAIGVVLGVVTGYRMVEGSDAFAQISGAFSVSVPQLLGLFIGPVTIATMAAWFPARSASRVMPAVALRIPE